MSPNNNFPVLGYDDLAAFQKSAADSNFMLNLGPGISNAKFDMRTWSPEMQAGTSFAQGFLGALLRGYGQQQVADQTKQAAALLPLLYSDPQSVQRPEGMDANAFQTLQGLAQLKKLQQEAYQQQAKQELFNDLLRENAKADIGARNDLSKVLMQGLASGDPLERNATERLLSRLRGATEGESAPKATPFERKVEEYGDPELARLAVKEESPEFKRDDLWKIEQAYTDKLLTGDQAKKVIEINKASRNIFEALKKENPLAASTAIFEFAKLQDPAGVVREADEMRVSDPGGPLGRLAQIHNEMLKKGKLTPEAKAAMREIVPIMQASTFMQYDQLRDGYLEAAKQYGANPERIKYVRPFDLSSYYQDELPQQQLDRLVGGGGGAMPSISTTQQLTEIRDALRSGALTQDQRGQLLERARQLTVGQDIASVMR